VDWVDTVDMVDMVDTVDMVDMVDGWTPVDFNKKEKLMNELLHSRTKKHFGLKVNPFQYEIKAVKDLYFSREHLFIREMMLDTARYEGFTGIVGEVGSGKTLMRYAVMDQLHREKIDIVYPHIRQCFAGKRTVNPVSLIDAIIIDLSNEQPKAKHEEKIRQAKKILMSRQNENRRQCMIIEEAHTLDMDAYKALKQIYEFQNGFRRLMGIILIGQVEMFNILKESRNPTMREVIRRIALAEIKGLGESIEEYIAHKMNRAQSKAEKVFDKSAYAAMDEKLIKKVEGKTVRTSYPLSVNALAVVAMNKAASLGETLVTGELIKRL